LESDCSQSSASTRLSSRRRRPWFTTKHRGSEPPHPTAAESIDLENNGGGACIVGFLKDALNERREPKVDDSLDGRDKSDSNSFGKSGTALSPLRPAGIAEIENQWVDVVSDGKFIDSGAPIVVTRVDGNRIVVRRHRTSTERS
jgi:hypothetical protein